MYPYDVCREFLAAVEAIGYTFDYGLDGIPYGLRLMGKSVVEDHLTK